MSGMVTSLRCSQELTRNSQNKVRTNLASRAKAVAAFAEPTVERTGTTFFLRLAGSTWLAIVSFMEARLYEEPSLITAEVKSAIAEASAFAPLHNRAELEGMRIVEKLLGSVPQIAVFDTGFHRQMPLSAVVYPGPYEWFQGGIRRYRISRHQPPVLCRAGRTAFAQGTQVRALGYLPLGQWLFSGCNPRRSQRRHHHGVYSPGGADDGHALWFDRPWNSDLLDAPRPTGWPSRLMMF